jgi:2-polyprenyl-3-methyl-5-hydroxy-6-metoxy-1,4-benzoquinol methylase
MHEPFLQANRDRWNELTAIHARSAFYDVAGFRAGKCTLRPIEVEELDDVAGKSLLHLQCHFGLDTLSWARRGARVTGVDFSEEAIALARSLGRELGIPGAFVCSDVYDLPTVLAGAFDVVFTSYGVLCWLPDLRRWAAVAAHFLKPGGTLYLAEIHPFAMVFDDRTPGPELRVAYPYFHAPEPLRSEPQGTYADRRAQVQHTTSYEWVHSLGDVVGAVIGAGLRVEFLHEFPYCICGILPLMEQGPDGWWRLREGDGTVPLLFSLKATKPLDG